MLTQIVVLYMAYQFGLPVWCRVLVIIGIGLKILEFLIGVCKGVYKAGKESQE